MTMRIANVTRESAEHVLPGHPDKLCDAAVDAIVEEVRRGDPGGQCGLEAACIFDSFFLTGRIAASPDVLDRLDLEGIIRKAWADAGYGTDAAGRTWGPRAEDLRIATRLCFGPFEPGERENRHRADDQAICVGWASDDGSTGHLPPAVHLARRIARRLHELRAEEGAGELGPDGKVLVEVERGPLGWRPLHVTISLNHHEASDWLLLRRIAEQAVEESTAGMPTPEILLNGAGTFLAGGPNGDNGLSGKKLVADAYGAGVPIGGGAWSGKDLRKVDRLGGMLARELALRAVHAGLAREARVTLLYSPGSEAPERVEPVLDGVFVDPADFLERLGDPPLDNRTTWLRYRECAIPLPELALWGHQQPGTPWEVRPETR